MDITGRWVGHAASEDDNAYEIVLGNPEEKLLFGRPKHRCEGNIKTDLGVIQCESVDWLV
jgi:hypothetical protein